MKKTIILLAIVSLVLMACDSTNNSNDLIDATISVSGFYSPATSSFSAIIFLTLSDGEWKDSPSYFSGDSESITQWIIFDNAGSLIPQRGKISAENPKVLSFAAYGHQSKTVTINKEKLGEIKAATNITGTLTIGTKTTTLAWLY